MSEPRPTSVVIPFPRSDDPQAQLRLALAGLNRALAEQRQEVARWRDSLNELRSAVSSIDTSLHSFRGSLDAVAPALNGLEAEALRAGALGRLVPRLSRRPDGPGDAACPADPPLSEGAGSYRAWRRP